MHTRNESIAPSTETSALHRHLALIAAGAFITALCVLPGCNTMEGAGEDIEAGGEAIQDAADGDD